MAPSVAIAGANGLVGKKITEQLLESGDFDVRILVRGTSKLEDAEKRGASMRSISYEDHKGIVEALKGIDVLISTVAGSGLESAQVALIQAAKEANVKLFIPSEFGVYFPDDKHKSPTVQAKKAVLRKAKEVGLPFAEIHTGGFPEICFVPETGFDFKIKGWLTYVLKHISLEDLQNKQLNIQGDAASVNDIVSLWKNKHNEELRVEYRFLEELESRFLAEPDDVWATLALEWAKGRGLPDHLDNQLYEDWKPETLESTL